MHVFSGNNSLEVLCLREFLSTRSVVSYGEDKYVPLHVFVDALNQFCVERNFDKFPIFGGWLDAICRKLTNNIVHVDFDLCDEEWPIGSEMMGRSVFIRNIAINSLTDEDLSSEVSRSCSDSSVTSSVVSSASSSAESSASGEN